MSVPVANRSFISPREFSETFGVSRAWVWRRIHDGTLRSVKVAGLRRIPVTEIARLAREARD